MIKQAGRIVSIEPVVEGLREVRACVDRTASELDIARLQQELDVLDYQNACPQQGLPGLTVASKGKN